MIAFLLQKQERRIFLLIQASYDFIEKEDIIGCFYWAYNTSREEENK